MFGLRKTIYEYQLCAGVGVTGHRIMGEKVCRVCVRATIAWEDNGRVMVAAWHLDMRQPQPIRRWFWQKPAVVQ